MPERVNRNPGWMGEATGESGLEHRLEVRSTAKEVQGWLTKLLTDIETTPSKFGPIDLEKLASFVREMAGQVRREPERALAIKALVEQQLQQGK